MFWTITFLILFLITLMSSILASYVAFRYARRLMAIEDRYEEALDMLDKCYAEIGKLLRRELMADSPEIRRIINLLRRSQETILAVANNITNFEEEDTDGDNSSSSN